MNPLSGDSFGRSRALVRGHGSQVFGTLALVFLVLIVAAIVIAAVLAGLPGAARQVLNGVIAPFLALVVTLGYYRLKAVESAP